MSITLRKNVVFWDVMLYVLIGLTVSIAVLSVGPLIAFGFLLIPVLTGHLFTNKMRQVTLLASLIGGSAAFLGFYIAYKLDLPVGPADVVLLGLIYGATWIMTRFLFRRLQQSNNVC